MQSTTCGCLLWGWFHTGWALLLCKPGFLSAQGPGVDSLTTEDTSGSASTCLCLCLCPAISLSLSTYLSISERASSRIGNGKPPGPPMGGVIQASGKIVVVFSFPMPHVWVFPGKFSQIRQGKFPSRKVGGVSRAHSLGLLETGRTFLGSPVWG